MSLQTQNDAEGENTDETGRVCGQAAGYGDRFADGLAKSGQCKRRVDGLTETVEEAYAHSDLGAEHVTDEEDEAALEVLFLTEPAFVGEPDGARDRDERDQNGEGNDDERLADARVRHHPARAYEHDDREDVEHCGREYAPRAE